MKPGRGRNWVLFASLGLAGLLLFAVGGWMVLSPLFIGWLSGVANHPSGNSTSTALSNTLQPAATNTPGFQFATPAGTVTPFVLATTTLQIDPTLLTLTPYQTFMMTPTPTPAVWQACPNTFLSHLWVGMKGKLSEEPPLPNRIRERAGTSYTVIGMIEPGEVVEIVDGPGCANNWVWWKIRKSDGLTGWTAEGNGQDTWLLPYIP
jgi:hypothetical protein